MNEAEFKSGLESMMTRYKNAPVESASAASLKTGKPVESVSKKETLESPKSEETHDFSEETVKNDHIEEIPEVSQEAPQELSQEGQIEYSEVEKKAMEKGWRPDYEGEGKVDAQTYLDRSPFFERINSQKKEIQAQKEALAALTEHFAQRRQEEINEALAQKEAERLALYKEGNVEAGVQKEIEMRKLHEAAQKDPILSKKLSQPQTQTNDEILASKPKEVQDFYNKYKNDWFNGNTPENRVMVNTANRISDTLMSNYAIQGIQVSMADHMREVERRMKSEFPQRFGNPNQSLPNAMGRSTSSGSTRPTQSSGQSLVSRMTDLQIKVAKMVENVSRDKRTGKPSMTVEDYARKLDREGKLKK